MLETYISKTSRSKALHDRAKNFLPAGVSYAIRHFEPYPFYTVRAKGSKLYDVDGNEYIDFWLGHTALILGHSPPTVMDAVKKQIEIGTHFGTSHELEIKLAEQVAKMVPNAEMIRFTNSGTEANMYAIRLARALTGRNIIVKFEGGWHGGYDTLHAGVKYPFDMPESAGLTAGALQDTILAPFNDLEGVKDRIGNEAVAAIIIEPMLGAGGCVPAEKEFLKGLKELCADMDMLLIFDEVVTGFRLAPGGGQQFFNVIPDITVFGKILGGGFPIGAFCGQRNIMQRLDTLIYERPDYSFHGGTFSANPISMTAGLATLELLEDGCLISEMNERGEEIREQTRKIFETRGVDVQVVGVGSVFSVHFTSEKVKDTRAVARADRKRLLEYHLTLTANGVFFLPTHMGALSTAHSEADLQRMLSETERFARLCGN